MYISVRYSEIRLVKNEATVIKKKGKHASLEDEGRILDAKVDIFANVSIKRVHRRKLIWLNSLMLQTESCGKNRKMSRC